MSEQNRKDLEEINEIYLKGLNFHFVRNVMDVFTIALLKEKVDKPLAVA
jgi:ATP-dependent Lon protease